MADYVICVDDDQTVLNQLSDQISRRLGDEYRVECAQSAEEALTLLRELHDAGDAVGLVICDQVMPGMKGDRFLEIVNKSWPDIMKILLTGEAGLESAIFAINRAGLHRYIEKPWEPEDLFLAVHNLLTQFRLRRDLALYHAGLERKTRELASLHEVTTELASTEEPARVLAAVCDAACRILGVRHAAVLALVAGDKGARWHGLPTEGIDANVQAAFERCLTESRLKGVTSEPPEVAFPGLIEPISHGHTLYGWLLLAPAPRRARDSGDALSILAAAAGAVLRGMELAAGRLEVERLSTIGRMLSSIVHDFRNPMTLIKGYGSMLADGELPGNRRQQYSNLIVEEADRISAMIEELLDFTRGRRTTLRPAPITVFDLVEKLRGWLAADLEQRGLTFAADLGYTGPLVVDIDRLKRALLNAATNAMDAMETGGRLTIESRVHGGRIEISVCDTGRGIPKDVQERVFEPFFSHGKRHGLGLGMTIMRKIVEEHGGEVALSSVPDQGTRLTFRFPEVAPESPPA